VNLPAVEVVKCDTVSHVQSEGCNGSIEAGAIAPFIKFEDVDTHFRPRFVQFKSATSINLHGDLTSGTTQQHTKTACQPVQQENLVVDGGQMNFCLKFEDLQCQYRPQYAEFATSVCINLDGDISSGIFSSISKKQIEKKKFQRKLYRYCECCDVEYTDLNTHLCSFRHWMFVLTKSNYEALDNMIDNVNFSLHSDNLSNINSDWTLWSRENVTCDKIDRATNVLTDLRLVDYSESSSQNEVHFIFYYFVFEVVN